MTNLDPIVRALREQLPELEILEYEPMRAHCSFRIGGPARALVRPASAEETAAVCRIVRGGGAQPLLIGNGTNLLITDGDVDRIVVQMGERMADVARTDATHLRAGAGIPLARLAQAALGYGLAGLEFAHGIPGSLGGAVTMPIWAISGLSFSILYPTLVMSIRLYFPAQQVSGAAGTILSIASLADILFNVGFGKLVDMTGYAVSIRVLPLSALAFFIVFMLFTKFCKPTQKLK